MNKQIYEIKFQPEFLPVAANKFSSYPAIDALCLGAFGLSLPAVPSPDEFLICQASVLGGFPFVEVMSPIEEL